MRKIFFVAILFLMSITNTQAMFSDLVPPEVRAIGRQLKIINRRIDKITEEMSVISDGIRKNPATHLSSSHITLEESPVSFAVISIEIALQPLWDELATLRNERKKIIRENRDLLQRYAAHLSY